MRQEVLGYMLITLIVLALTITPQAGSQPSVPAKATVSARIEYGYGLVFYDVELPEQVSLLSFNLSGFSDRLVLSVAQSENQRNIIGYKENNIIKFNLNNPAKRINITFVFDVIRSTPSNIEIKFPVPLSPLGYTVNVTGSASFSAGVSLNSTFGKVSGSQINYNATLPPATLDIISGSVAPTQIPVGRIASLNRTILIEPERITYNDTVEIIQLSNYPIASLAIALPRGYVFDGAEGLLGPYPKNYWNIYNASGSTLIMITLLSSVQLWGQRTMISLQYHTNRANAINAYMGLGFTVTNYSVKICIRGSLELPKDLLQSEITSGDLHCYMLKTIGPLFQANLYPNVTVSNVTFSQGRGLSLTAALVVVTVIGFLAATGIFVVLRMRRVQVDKAKEMVLKKTALSSDAFDSVYKSLVRRQELLITTLENLRSLRVRKAGTARITTVIREYEKRDSAIEAETSKVLGQLGDAGRVIASELANLRETIYQRIREIEKIERSYRVGKLDKKEYNEKIEAIENELHGLARRFMEIAEKYL